MRRLYDTRIELEGFYEKSSNTLITQSYIDNALKLRVYVTIRCADKGGLIVGCKRYDYEKAVIQETLEGEEALDNFLKQQHNLKNSPVQHNTLLVLELIFKIIKEEYNFYKRKESKTNK